MESAKEVNIVESVDHRRDAMLHWLNHECQLTITAIDAVTGDASFRRYFRIHTPTATYIAMDAPPALENCRPFVAISRMLKAHHLQTPDIFVEDVASGFLLISDFGDTTYLKALTADNADELYRTALRALANIQSCRDVPNWEIKPFDVTWLRNEWMWHKEWFLDKWLGIDYTTDKIKLDACYDILITSAISQPQVFMHRDFHSGNLMLLPNHSVGILDFQDAFIGPLTYDVASLLRDCYIDWPAVKVDEWMTYYFELLVEKNVVRSDDFLQYQRWFDLMGIQRHLKALLTFSRKHVRDNQPQYLQFVPRTLQYLIDVSGKYAELSALHVFLVNVVMPRVNEWNLSNR